MSIETLNPQAEDLSKQLTTANGLNEAAIRAKFGNPLEVVRTTGLDQLIDPSQIGKSKIPNPNVIKIEITPKPAVSVKPAIKANVVEIKDLPKVKEVTGKQLAFNVGLYRNLYNEILAVSGGNREIAERDVYQAVLRDGTSFIQESVSALTGENGERIFKNKVFQATAQQTATVHAFDQIKNPETGQYVITSPEYVATGRSVTTSITGWRRGNDHAAISLIESLVNNLPDNPEGKGYTLMWASPKAEEWEDEWVRKYNTEYGYQYVGQLTGPAGKRQLIVHSYKADAKTETFDTFAQSHQGEIYQASFEDKKERPLLDRLMRSVKVVSGSISGSEVISGLYNAKQQVEGSDRMFGILESTMHFVQDENLRQRIENEASSPVAHWIVAQIIKGVPDNQIQAGVIDRFVKETKALERRIQEEEKVATQIHNQNLKSYPIYKLDSNPFSDDRALLMVDLQQRVQTLGMGCGEIGGSPSVSFGSNSVQDIINNYSGISGMRRNALVGGGVSNEESDKCSSCQKYLCGKKSCCGISY